MKLISYVLTFAVLFPSSLLHAESYVAKNDFEKAILLQATDFMDHSLREGLDPNAPLDSEGHTYLMLAAINSLLRNYWNTKRRLTKLIITGTLLSISLWQRVKCKLQNCLQNTKRM